MSEQRNSKNWLYLSVIAALTACCTYLFVTKNKQQDKTHEVTQQLAETTSSKQALQDEYNAALQRIDEMKGGSIIMNKLLNERNSEIQNLLQQIQAIKNNGAATEEDLKRARSLVATLQSKLDVFQKQIDELKKANAALATEKNQVTAERDKVVQEKKQVENSNTQLTQEKANLEQSNVDLSNKVELGKILHAGNIRLEPVKKRWINGKEVSTEKARRADLMRITFDLDENRLTETGEKLVHIVIYAPDGSAYKTGQFTLKDGTQKSYTLTKNVPYSQGKPTKDISLDWKPNGKFEEGDYSVEIYHQGYKIGEQTIKLK